MYNILNRAYLKTEHRVV